MALSDMMRHWQSIKLQYEDCIIFYRLGDFYEMFFEDAQEASKILELTLTGRDCGLEERAPMCGVPYHAAENYIAKLVENGKKVAICEQLTEPTKGVKLVERDVIRVVTQGTLLNDGQIDEKSNNFLCSVFCDDKYCSISWCDITTGDFFVEDLSPYNENKLIDALVRVNPSQIIASTKIFKLSGNFSAVIHGVLPRFELYKDYAYSYNNAKNLLLNQFNVSSLNAFIPEENKGLVCVSGALIEYLNETQKQILKNIIKLNNFEGENCLKLDGSALNNLEILSSNRDRKSYGSLFWAIDNTKTSMGARYLKSQLVAPLKDLELIKYRQQGVKDLFDDTLTREGVIDLLRNVKDLERLIGKLTNNVASPRDLLSINETLLAVSPLKMLIVGHRSKALNDIYANLGDYEEICKILSSAISENPPINIKDCGFVKDGFDKNLDELRNLKSNGTKRIEEMELSEKEKTGIKTLKIKYNKVFGYFIEVSNSFKDQVPYNYVRKQTLTNGERFITEELKKFEEDVLTCNEKILAIETEIFKKIKNLLLDNVSSLLKTAKCFAFLDFLLSLAIVAKKRAYVMPTMVEEDCELNIVGGRHPVVEAVSKQTFIPNDTSLDLNENRMMVITGPNMAGKSTYMRQVALIVILAQIGSFVPCKSAQIPIVDKIFTRVGASDYLIFDQSTFMVEMTEVAKILHNATKHSLLILDEVGRGTSTFDGLSIAWAVVEFLAKNIGAKTLFATHYHELSELEGIIFGVKNYKITVREINGSIVFLRKIMRGSANKSFGIEVASLAGVPENVTKRAKTILKKLEKKDLTIDFSKQTDLEAEEKTFSEVEKIISELNVNAISPLQAFEILIDLKGKLNG